MPENDGLMFDIDVFDKKTFLFTYRAYICPSKGDFISTPDGELKVKRVVAFPMLSENFDVHVKRAKNA